MNANMQLVTKQSELDSLVGLFADVPYFTIDTEFIRERTYWPRLCLVQMARPVAEGEPDCAWLIDPLADLDLEPLFELLRDETITKVFHAARQDIEIFVNLMGEVPKSIVDTQVAAMVCGYGDQVGYETLVRKIAKASIDKSSRFTDWSRRPLSDKQLRYAAADVTYLRDIHEHLSAMLAETGRSSWVASEMETLTSIDTYVVQPENAWLRIKTRSNDRKFLGVVRALAEWREREAQARDVPRGRLMKDDAILEIAAAKPTEKEQLHQLRSLQREARKPETSDALMAAVAAGLEAPVSAPKRGAEPPKRPRPGGQALSELLRVLLKAKADQLGVAQRLIASAAELDALANDPEAEPRLLTGWRREAFGDDALRLIAGEIALSAGPNGVRIVPLS